MKKYFEVVETVRYSHRIVIEIKESQDDEFEDFAERVAEYMNDRRYTSTDEIISEFAEEFGDDSIEFIEDGSPETEMEAY